jgi:glutathione S-transferase
MSLKLYFAPATRSTRVRHLLEELGVPYELVRINMKEGEHKRPDYLERVHPHGSVPALEVDGKTIFESGAIVAYLADRFMDKGLAPTLDSPDRPAYMQWLFYAYATLEPAVQAMARANNPNNAVSDEDKAKDAERWATITRVLSRQLEGKDWFFGSFSALDCLYGSLLVWADSMKLLDDKPVIKGYAERIRSRPQFQAARK